jgi:hypothetical protein
MLRATGVPGHKRHKLPVALSTTILALLAGCGSSESGGGSSGSGGVDVSRSAFTTAGKKWPLTVDSGTVACESGHRVTFTSAGKTYALNGTAKGDGRWADIGPIWADDGSGMGLKVDIGDLIDAGLARCD